MMKLLMISCKKATYLLSKKEENRLSLLDRIRLKSHLALCYICRRFEEQTQLITRHSHKDAENACLTPEKKENIKRALVEADN